MNRAWLIWIVALGLAFALVSKSKEVAELWHTLAAGHLGWILAAVALQGVYFALFGALYQACFWAVELNRRFRDMYAMTLASMTVSLLVPSAGNALFFDDTLARNESGARATAAIFLQRATDFGVFWAFLFGAMCWMGPRHLLNKWIVLAATVLFFVVLAWSGSLLLAMWRAEWLRRLLTGLERPLGWCARRCRHPEWIGEGWGARHAGEFTEASAFIAAQPLRLIPVFAVSIGMQVVLIACLWALCRAFDMHLPLGLLVSGFSVGVLFWVVAVTPSGVGVVEAMMAMLFSAFGFDHAKSVAIALAFRGITFWLPVLGGMVLLKRVRTFRSQVSGSGGPHQTVAILTAVMGLINLWSSVMPEVQPKVDAFSRWSVLHISSGGRLTSAIGGFALLVLARSLARRKHGAWTVTLVWLLLSAVGHLVKGPDPIEAGLALALALYLACNQRQFHAAPDPPGYRQAAAAFITALLFMVAYGTVGFFLLDAQKEVQFSLRDALLQTVVMFTQFRDPGWQPAIIYAPFLKWSLYVVGALTESYAMVMLMRPAFLRRRAQPGRRERAQAIIERWGRGPLAGLRLTEDKTWWFSAGESLVAYTLQGKVALALGGPLGPPSDADAALSAFCEHCREQGWLPAFYQIDGDRLRLYRDAGLRIIALGHQTVVDVAEFDLQRPALASLRQSYERLERLGYRARLHEPQLAPALHNALREISDEWLADHRETEKHFSLGWFHDDCLGWQDVLVVTDHRERPVAFATLLPGFCTARYGLDMLRHHTDVEPGMLDFVVVSLLRWAQEAGLRSVELGLTPLPGTSDDEHLPEVQRTLTLIAAHVDKCHNFKGLHRFKLRCDARFEPRYLAYPGTEHLAAVWAALLRADSGERPASGPARV